MLTNKFQAISFTSPKLKFKHDIFMIGPHASARQESIELNSVEYKESHVPWFGVLVFFSFSMHLFITAQSFWCILFTCFMQMSCDLSSFWFQRNVSRRWVWKAEPFGTRTSLRVPPSTAATSVLNMAGELNLNRWLLRERIHLPNICISRRLDPRCN